MVELLVTWCAGLDVAKDEVVACVRVPDGTGGRRQEARTFQIFTSSLETLADWLQAEGVTQVVMEATGQYWKPMWQVLEERGFQLLLVNAHQSARRLECSARVVHRPRVGPSVQVAPPRRHPYGTDHCCETKHGRRMTSSNAGRVAPTLAFTVVGCWLLSVLP